MYRVEERGCTVSAAVERREAEVQKDGMDSDKHGGGDPRPESREREPSPGVCVGEHERTPKCMKNSV